MDVPDVPLSCEETRRLVSIFDYESCILDFVRNSDDSALILDFVESKSEKTEWNNDESPYDGQYR